MRLVRDDLDREIALGSVRRIVSLVPSLTESIAYDAPDRLVGVTDWCSHPSGLCAARIGGTKKPAIARIQALRPDVVVANQEENNRADVEALVASGVPVYVTNPDTLDDAFGSIERLLRALELPRGAWIDTAKRVWAQPVTDLVGVRAACFIWRKPWLAVGAQTFAGDLIERLGMRNVVTELRYPKTDPSVDADLILLPDEPYAFGPTDGPESFAGRRCALFDGRYLTWYGPSLVAAPSVISGAARGAVMAI